MIYVCIELVAWVLSPGYPLGYPRLFRLEGAELNPSAFLWFEGGGDEFVYLNGGEFSSGRFELLPGGELDFAAFLAVVPFLQESY
jgi:hypothetical protein